MQNPYRQFDVGGEQEYIPTEDLDLEQELALQESFVSSSDQSLADRRAAWIAGFDGEQEEIPTDSGHKSRRWRRAPVEEQKIQTDFCQSWATGVNSTSGELDYHTQIRCRNYDICTGCRALKVIEEKERAKRIMALHGSSCVMLPDADATALVRGIADNTKYLRIPLPGNLALVYYVSDGQTSTITQQQLDSLDWDAIAIGDPGRNRSGYLGVKPTAPCQDEPFGYAAEVVILEGDFKQNSPEVVDAKEKAIAETFYLDPRQLKEIPGAAAIRIAAYKRHLGRNGVPFNTLFHYRLEKLITSIDWQHNLYCYKFWDWKAKGLIDERKLARVVHNATPERANELRAMALLVGIAIL